MSWFLVSRNGFLIMRMKACRLMPIRRCLSLLSATDSSTVEPILASLAEYQCVSGRHQEEQLLTRTSPLPVTEYQSRSPPSKALPGKFNVFIPPCAHILLRSRDNLTFQLGDYDSLVRVFQLAVKRHGIIDQVVGYFPNGLPGNKEGLQRRTMLTS